MKVIYQKTKTLVTKPNNNSSDAISPNFIYGCSGGCMKSYCYVGRYNRDTVRVNTNWNNIFSSIVQWRSKQPVIKIPNQQSNTQYVIDIGCNSDLPLHQKHLTKSHHIYEPLFELQSGSGLWEMLAWFDSTKDLQPTFATKYSSMLKLNVTKLKRKPRVRISIMSEKYMNILEPNTTPYWTRIHDIARLQKLGWEVHINFSPVIVMKDWLQEYTKLFNDINSVEFNKEDVKCEVIFLTNHQNSMNVASIEAQNIMKYSSEVKNKSGVMRYPIRLKRELVNNFKQLHQELISWCEIRYIF